jgi:hypothetical protein
MVENTARKRIQSNGKILCACGCGELIPAMNVHGLKATYKTHHNLKVREKHPAYRGGRRDRNGYIYIYTPEHPNADYNGYVAEHRLVMEAYLGRYLRLDEIVHHINEDKLDNRIENLQLITRGEHVIIHRPVDYREFQKLAKKIEMEKRLDISPILDFFL